MSTDRATRSTGRRRWSFMPVDTPAGRIRFHVSRCGLEIGHRRIRLATTATRR